MHKGRTSPRSRRGIDFADLLQSDLNHRFQVNADPRLFMRRAHLYFDLSQRRLDRGLTFVVRDGGSPTSHETAAAYYHALADARPAVAPAYHYRELALEQDVILERRPV
jgi:hypothetical protein